MIIYFNDDFIEEDSARISVRDRGFLLGDGIFTTIKATSGQIEYFNQHFDRLKRHSALIFLDFPFSQHYLAQVCKRLLELNHLEHVDTLIRITLTRGASTRGINIIAGIKPSILITATKYKDNLEYCPRLTLSQFVRNERSILSKIKSLNYIESVLAREYALRAGYDDALFLNTNNNISETSVSNIFFIRNKVVHTPKLIDGALDGVIRSQVIETCRQSQLEVIECSIQSNEISTFTEAFITNCAIGIKPVYSIDQHVFSAKKLTSQILEIYNQTLGG